MQGHHQQHQILFIFTPQHSLACIGINSDISLLWKQLWACKNTIHGKDKKITRHKDQYCAENI
jgi:hypothetical protein